MTPFKEAYYRQIYREYTNLAHLGPEVAVTGAMWLAQRAAYAGLFQ